MNIEIGATHRQVFDVTRELCTARGDNWILSSPQLIFMMERTARELVGATLPDTHDTVGVSVTFQHKAATVEGMRVTVDADVTGVDGRFIDFDLVARDDIDEIGVMRHKRALIDLDSYAQRLSKKQERWRETR